MTDEERALHNSGKELASRSEEELHAELLQSFPGGKRWDGLTYELNRRASERQQKIARRTLWIAVATLGVAAAGVIVTLLAG
jgi:hypothetical protein